MHRLSWLFRGTPLEQNNYKLMTTTPVDSCKSPVYTMTRIRDWNYGYYKTDSLELREMFLHEICHVIEMYERDGGFDKLLKPNFGYKFAMIGAGLTKGALKTEAFVLSLQHLIAVDIFGDSIEAFKSPAVINGFRISADVFAAMCDDAKTLHIRRGLNYYYDNWQEACDRLIRYRRYHCVP